MKGPVDVDPVAGLGYMLIVSSLLLMALFHTYGLGLVAMGLGIVLGSFWGIGRFTYGMRKLWGAVGFLQICAGVILAFLGW